jgi:hypothetical protein
VVVAGVQAVIIYTEEHMYIKERRVERRDERRDKSGGEGGGGGGEG